MQSGAVPDTLREQGEQENPEVLIERSAANQCFEMVLIDELKGKSIGNHSVYSTFTVLCGFSLKLKMFFGI